MQLQISKCCLEIPKCLSDDFIIHSSITASTFAREEESKRDKGIDHENLRIVTCLRSSIKALCKAVLYIHQQRPHSISLSVLLRVVKETHDRFGNMRTSLRIQIYFHESYHSFHDLIQNQIIQLPKLHIYITSARLSTHVY